MLKSEHIIVAGVAVGLAVLLWPNSATAIPMSTQHDPLATPSGAPQGEGATSILTRTATLSQAAREREFVALIERGNVPSWTWQTVEIRSGLRAMGDFLAVGNDDDFVWVPLTPGAAIALLAAHSMRLPHRDEADAIFNLASNRGGFLPFRSFTPAPGQTRWGNTAIAETRRRIEADRIGRRGLLDGYKKYVLGRERGKVIIYGGHSADGSQVQPYSTIHDESYLDYSHGIRGVMA